MRKLFTFLCAALMSAGSMMADTTVTWGASDFSSITDDQIIAGTTKTVKGISITVNAGTNNYIEYYDAVHALMFSATNDNAFTFSTELGNITKIEITTLYANGTLGDGWTIGENSATWEGNTNTLNFCNAGSLLAVSNIIFTFGEPAPQPASTDTITWDKNFCMDVEAYYDGDEERVIEANNTKDGITVTFVGNEMDDGLIGDVIELYDESSILTFTSTVGNFQKIEIYYAENLHSTPNGWTLDATNEKFVWEGTPAAAVNMVKGTGDVSIEIDHIVFIVESQGKPTAIENTNLKSEIKNHKLIKDGMLLIEKNGKIYNVQGVEVR